MTIIPSRRGAAAFAAAACVAAVLPAVAAGPDIVVSERVKQLTRATPWKPAGTIAVKFNTHHPQGMVKIDDVYWVSSVEIITPTKRFPAPVGGYDRDTGEGKGHLFKIDAQGKGSLRIMLSETLPLGTSMCGTPTQNG